jgi:serine/threonine protein kinase
MTRRRVRHRHGFGDRYRIVEMLGRGATGEVYRADDLRLGQPVALKFLPPHLAENEGARARIRNEVRVARQVSHSNVCRVYDIAEADGEAFISMEYVDGEDLRSVLRRLGRPSREKACEIARQLCAALAAAHEMGVLHRDLKPENIMIDGRGRVRITDFGLASFQRELEERALAGTPAYTAPELFAGAQASTRSDLYALGAVLYELFTGRAAFPVHVSLLGFAPPAKPAVVLAERARELLARLAHVKPPVDTAYGYGTYFAYLDHIAGTDTAPARWAALSTRRPRPYAFWYRESPVPLVPAHAMGEVLAGDPPQAIAGMASLVLDDAGRLQVLQVVAPQRDTTTASADPPDYPLFFEAAGLDLADFRAVSPEWNPLLPSDSRSAWIGHYAGQDEAVRVEAASYRGRPVYFHVIESFDRP